MKKILLAVAGFVVAIALLFVFEYLSKTVVWDYEIFIKDS